MRIDRHAILQPVAVRQRTFIDWHRFGDAAVTGQRRKRDQRQHDSCNVRHPPLAMLSNDGCLIPENFSLFQAELR
jgi:hypothetical protein